MSDKPTIEATVTLRDYGDNAMFMRSVRATGKTLDGREVEMAVNELGAGLIVRIGKRTLVLREDELVRAVDAALGIGDDDVR